MKSKSVINKTKEISDNVTRLRVHSPASCAVRLYLAIDVL